MSSGDCKDILIPKEDRKWYYFVLTSVALFIGGLILILFSRLLVKLFESNSTKTGRVTPPSSAKKRKTNTHQSAYDKAEDDGGFYIGIKEAAGSLINAKTLTGKIMVRPC